MPCLVTAVLKKISMIWIRPIVYVLVTHAYILLFLETNETKKKEKKKYTPKNPQNKR
jgi:hypothetical protein